MSTIYSLDDISTHCKKDDIWMTIHNKVYNITAFMNEVKNGMDELYHLTMT
jgi:cytochrome-b5 reductase